MVLFICIIVLCIISISCHDETRKVFNISRKIIGGYDCSTEKYPFVVSIRTASHLEHFCGGSLISNVWVLTAAHCLTSDNPGVYSVIAGTSEFKSDGIQRQTVKSLFVYPKYNPNVKGHDIALIRLGSPFDLSTNLVATIDLPSSELDGDVKDYCQEPMVIGWGHRQSWNPKDKPLEYVFNPILQCISIPILSAQECFDLVKSRPPENMVCVYFQNGSKDSCQGDSGGPLFCNGTLYGLVSFGYGCAMVNKPGFYTRVDKYLSFIRDTMDNYTEFRIMRSKCTNRTIPIIGITFNILILYCFFF
ncbi:hypothetical protein WA026_017851 [Henosepilachna vigintioctopunctata]|uniref:Peptidase S1 domain-containing protein n=1 Tax=Henosepilachna vigintioctopunctata TaxID=420089 RepID=A0AAW1TPY7_9CUCU